ncbi:dethiobiotin synthase [Vibrio zhugei]|uniref:ATP-dependent dethiobiotin synthetase BioD n=1 Tax=Vibrio zhugei TaxID=2479546 RepID=A0ABV7CAQ8_9VIBR|nr:dethiobiotin synthase [Vibrio zhugei]
MGQVFFIAGTDAGVGKTVVAKAMLQVLAEQHLTTIGYKPVSTGCDNTELGYVNQDAAYLMQAATEPADYHDVNPYMLPLRTSPHIAAEHEGVDVTYDVLDNALAKHRDHADVVVVEGIGGWRVPLAKTTCLSTWVARANIPVVLVVGIQVGCINHALLTAEAIRSDGLQLVGWVANRINPGTEHYAEIIHTLESCLDSPKLGEIPYVPSALRRDLGKYLTLERAIE